MDYQGIVFFLLLDDPLTLSEWGKCEPVVRSLSRFFHHDDQSLFSVRDSKTRKRAQSWVQSIVNMYSDSLLDVDRDRWWRLVVALEIQQQMPLSFSFRCGDFTTCRSWLADSWLGCLQPRLEHEWCRILTKSTKRFSKNQIVFVLEHFPMFQHPRWRQWWAQNPRPLSVSQVRTVLKLQNTRLLWRRKSRFDLWLDLFWSRETLDSWWTWFSAFGLTRLFQPPERDEPCPLTLVDEYVRVWEDCQPQLLSDRQWSLAMPDGSLHHVPFPKRNIVVESTRLLDGVLAGEFVGWREYSIRDRSSFAAQVRQMMSVLWVTCFEVRFFAIKRSEELFTGMKEPLTTEFGKATGIVDGFVWFDRSSLPFRPKDETKKNSFCRLVHVHCLLHLPRQRHVTLLEFGLVFRVSKNMENELAFFCEEFSRHIDFWELEKQRLILGHRRIVSAARCWQ